ncbi:LamG-like jellyroll fold domain-containing protein [Zunongwangia sp. F363]|uniref:LamG-like jellyroll fold domain-containing protein n=1 Tax=Autumnicola tepida TaxID=3075595 RepID=A0ABU3C5S3_9FLAO|nr:LamG-like jellyroll fold domain-containing protein [Zunongwangia sp. F363]MDT0641669.1 LamG-like jellyroll fold domain-containing protein [Zunongwangia sp. F363]
MGKITPRIKATGISIFLIVFIGYFLPANNLTFNESPYRAFDGKEISYAKSELENPQITAPADKTVNTGNGSCSATGIQLGSPTITGEYDNLRLEVNGSEISPNTYSFPLGTTVITWIVSNAEGASDSDTQIITVEDNTDPTVITKNISIALDASGNASITSADVDNGSSDNCGIKSYTLDKENFSCADVGPNTVTLTVTDNNENSATATATVTVEDNTDPTVITKNISIVLDASGNASIIPADVDNGSSDNCGIKSYTLDKENFSCTDVGPNTVTLTVTDNNENSATATATVTVEDNTDPTVITKNISITLDASGNAAIIPADIDNGTSDNCGIKSYSLDKENFSCTDVGPNTVTLTVIDNNENSATATATVTVEDNTDPTVITKNISIVLDASGNAAIIPADIDNGSSDNCGIKSYTLDRENFSCTDVGENTVALTVTDNNENTATATATVTVKDEELPVITTASEITVANDAGKCGASISITPPTATDNCTVGSPSGSRSDGKALTAEFPVGTTEITWNVSDANANNAVAVIQKITVEDKEAPELPAIEDVISGCEYTLTPPVATDNCSGEITATTSNPLTYSAEGTHTITWKFTDAAGNTSTIKQDVVISPLGAELEVANISCKGASDGSIEMMFAYGGHDTFEYSIDGSNWQASNTFSSLAPGTYNVQMRDSSEPGCILVLDGNLEITEPEVLTAAIASTTDVLCKGFATGEITASATGGTAPYTFSWGSLGYGENKTDLPAGEYELIVTDANGCKTEPIAVTITEPASFIEITEVTSTSGCFEANNGTATVKAVGGTGQYSYLWEDGQTTQTATGLAPGDHTVVITDENGCEKERTVTVSSPTKLEISGFLTTETTSYGSATGSATVQVTGGSPNYTFEWSDGQTGQTAQNLTAGTYTVTVTDQNGCTASRSVVVIDSLDAEILPTSICESTNDIIRTSSFTILDGSARGGTAPYNYEWTFKGDASISKYTGLQTPKINYESIGDKEISVKITDANGVSLTKTIIQYVGACFVTDCGSNDLTAEDYYIGDSSGTRITAENCGSSDDKFIYIYIPSNPKRYSLSVEFIYSIENIETGEVENHRELGCFYEKEDIPDKAQTFQIDYSCGDIVKIDGVRFTFAQNKNRECGQGSKPKCFSTNNETTVFSPLYAVAFANELLCNGSEDGKITIRASGGVSPYQYFLNGKEYDTNIIEGLPGGTYNIEVRDAEGESHFMTKEINQPSNPLQLNLVEQTDVTCFGGTDGSATVAAEGGTPATSGDAYIYVWDNGQTGPTATNLEAGDHDVRVLDANGCETWITVTITQPEELIANAGPDQVLSCGITTTQLSASLPTENSEEFTGEWSIVNGPAGGSFADATNPETSFTGTQGTYTLRWTVDCGKSDDVKITLSNCNTIDFDGKDDYIVFGDNFNGSTNFSLEAWIKLSPEASSGLKTVISKRSTTDFSSSGYDLVIDNRTPKFRWNGNTLSSSDPIGTNRWYHLAVITKSEGTYILVDGLEVGKASAASLTANNYPFIIGAMYNADNPEEPSNYFHGWVEEVRIWDTALSENQLHFMMNQRLEQNGANVRGEIIPLDVPEGLRWDKLKGYYQLEKIENGYTPNKASLAVKGRMVNITTNQERTAPLPYISARTGYWYSNNTWKRPQVWDPPNSTGINGKKINWNIASISHTINSGDKDINLLGLLSESNKLTMINPNQAQNEFNGGKNLKISHYLKLNGIIDLVGESQLVQDEGSVLENSSTGYLERDQQGTANSYNYNYWTSPVSIQGSGNNSGFTIAEVLRDGTNSKNPIRLSFGHDYTFADKSYSGAKRISTYWLYKFEGTADSYGEWDYVGKEGHLDAGEGYTMKGTSGNVEISERQNYVFTGKPNNGEIRIKVSENENRLVGNPYPSAIDAEQFIRDNLKDVPGGTNSRNIFNGALYFWDHFGKKDSHNLAEYVGGYATFNLVDGVPAISTDSRIDATGDQGDKRPEKYIPVAQGFFVNTIIDEAIAEEYQINGGDILFKNGQRLSVKESTEESQFLKPLHLTKGNKAQYKKDERYKIRLNFSSPTGYHRQILVAADNLTTNGFDLGYDAPMMDYNLEDMFWIINDSEFVIQAVPDFNPGQVLPLGLAIDQEGEFKIEIAELENVPADMEIYLKNNADTTYHDLRAGEYKSTIEPGYHTSQFELVFEKPEESTEEEGQDPDNTEENEEDNSDDQEEEEGEGNSENPEEGSEGSEEESGNPETETPVEIPGEKDDLAELSADYMMDTKEIIISNPAETRIDEIRIYSINGKLIESFKEIPLQQEIHLTVSRPVSTAVYVVKIYSENKLINKKMIINN